MSTTIGAGGTDTVTRGAEPPELRGNPLWGSMRDFQSDKLGFLLEAARRGDVCRYRVANMRWYQINAPDGIGRVLQENNHNYVKSSVGAAIIKPVLGEGLFTSEGEHWLRQRRLMQPAFHRKSVALFGEMMVGSTLAMLGRWDDSPGEPFDLLAQMTSLTLDIATAALFHSRVGEEREEVARAITTIIADMSYRFEVPFYPPPAVPTPRNRRFRAALRTIDAAVYRIIADRRRGAGERRRGAGEEGDLLAMLMSARDPETGETMDDRQLRDEVITLFIAGHETTALALTWAFYLLARHPRAGERLRAELDSALGDRTTPTIADLPKLPFTKSVVDEALRLYPPAWITNRQAVADDVISGYRVPAGAFVVLSPYLLHRHPGLWERPDEFDPDRFSTERSAGRPRNAYLPFGRGPRQCIGQAMALAEAQLILATVAARCRLRLVSDAPAEPEALATLRPRGGLEVVAESV